MLLHGSTSQPSAALLTQESQDIRHPADGAAIMPLLWEPEGYDSQTGSEPLGTGRKASASCDVDLRVAGPVFLPPVPHLSCPLVDGEKAHPAGDTAAMLLRGSTSQPSAALLTQESQDIRHPAGDSAAMLLLREPEVCDFLVRERALGCGP